MLVLEQDFFLQTSHTIFIRLYVASLNAYWYSRSLHELNWFYPTEAFWNKPQVSNRPAL